MFIKQLSTVVLAGSLLLTGCAGRTAARPDLPQPAASVAVGAERPNMRADAGNLPQPPQQGQREGRPQRLPGNEERQNGQALAAAVNPQQLAPIPDYGAAQVLTTFAQDYLGIQPTVVHAQGTTGDIALPPQVSQQVNGSVSLAGQVSAGMITVGNYRGAAQVAVGSGTISGDLEADISNAALGAYSLLMPGVATPTDAGAALALITSIDAHTGAVIGQLSTGALSNPHAIAFAPNGYRAYISDFTGRRLLVINVIKPALYLPLIVR